ncbi:DUF4190 domain-containing protein [Glycomyces terrestris]|uniref:DUF4190 domain-containing protein n=1 Tax=Glycomyces terrestris TaxID=2493553 RepID=UPI001651F7EB|nr:DUF4190 domain-containing protein [Glycomyces terrestris]
MTYPPTPDQSGQGGFQYDPYGSQPGSQPEQPGYSPQPQQPGYQPQQPGYGPAPQLPPAAPGYPPQYGVPGPYGPQLPKGQAIASMVLGIIGVGILCLPIPYVSGIISLGCGVTAAILGGIAMKKINQGLAGGKGQAITGLVLGIIVCALALIALIAVGSLLAMFGSAATTTTY